jgi:hypothetical protein
MNPSLKKGAWPAFKKWTISDVVLPEEATEKIFRILFSDEIRSNPLIRKMEFRAENIPSPPRCVIPNLHDRWLVSLETDYERRWRDAEWGYKYFLGGLPLTLFRSGWEDTQESQRQAAYPEVLGVVNVRLLALYEFQRKAFTEAKSWYVLSSDLPKYHPGWIDPVNPDQIINGRDPGSYQRYVRFLMDEEERYIQ